MASKQPLKLFDVKMMALRIWLNFRYFVVHNIFMRKKNLLIIGDEKSDIYQSLSQRLSNKWNVNLVNDSNTSNHKESVIQFYKEQEKSLNIKNIDAIVVLPETKISQNHYDIESEEIISWFPQIYSHALIKNVFAYKMALKYLSQTGVIILSCNQKQFYNLKPLDFQQYGRGRQKLNLKSNPYEEYSLSECLLDGPITYLGILLGERYELSLNSHSIIALSTEQSKNDSQVITKFYADWMNRKNLPQPGSFARFIPPNEKTSTTFVEYL